MEYTNSSLVSYTQLSPNNGGLRTHTIDTITIHCIVGQLSVETLGNIFADIKRDASSNYGIGADGRIGMYCEEKNISYCSSSRSNDNRAITIEVACEPYAPYEVNDVVMESLINLCTDICKRNNIKKLLWQADKSLIGQVDKQNMTVHRWFFDTACPGDYLYEKHSYIAEEVNKRLLTYEWKQNATGWWYECSDDSYPTSQWLKLDAWYYFDDRGYAIQNRWELIDGKWYYFGDDCRMKTGWVLLKGKWYYLDENGAMVKGWQKLKEKWYYMDANGEMLVGLQIIDGSVYYFAEDGHMCTTNESGALV